MRLRRQLPVYSPVSGAAIRRALRSGLAPGRDGQAGFQASLREDYAADQVALFASGTQALQTALELVMRRAGDRRVALPAYTCFDVASAAVGARGGRGGRGEDGARLSFYDLDPATLSPDLDSLRRRFQDGVRIVVVSPLYGFPVDWEALQALSAEFGAIIVEDAAQGAGARWLGRRLGSLGPVSVLSFGRGKGWTGGGGGALLVRGAADTLAPLDSDAIPRRAAELRVLAKLAAQWALGRPQWYAIPHAVPWLRLGETLYHDPSPAQPMTRAASACLAASRLAAEREGTVRRAAAEAFLSGVRSSRDVEPIRPIPGARPGYLRLPLRLSQGVAGFADPAAAARMGVSPGYPSVLAAIPQIRASVEPSSDHWPGAEALVRTLFTLPTHSRMTAGDWNDLRRHVQTYGDRP